ncbi:hypothetical protein GCM10023210_26960 [Chryseobacterium ginsengisoli]|uniref:Lipoprotein n=1 Tax=Chryseobacterium ginsengisoli TaxID=363853 RepID=A0ABP9MGX0_9FLAO
MKMNLSAIMIGFICLFLQCSNAKETPIINSTSEKNKSMNKNSYFIDYSLRGNFEIYFNGILIERKNTNGTIMNYQYLNQFIEESGEQDITIKILPENGNTEISPNVLKSIALKIYFSENGDTPPLKMVKNLVLPSYSKPQNTVVYNWKVKMEVPFMRSKLKNIATNLTQENIDRLFQEVKDYYINVQGIINSGDSKEYLRLYKNSIERETETSYYTAQKKEDYITNLADRVEKSKNGMLQIPNTQIVIHPNGLIVELQDKNYNTPLMSKDNSGKTRTFGLQLYRSIKTGKLEVY